MTKLSLLAVSLGTGLAFAAIPTSINLAPANVMSFSLLSIDTAEARVGRPLTPLSVAGVHRRAYRRGAYGGGYYGGGYYGGRYYGGGYYGRGAGVAAAGAVAAGAVATGAYAAYPASAPAFVNEAVQVEPGLSATVTDPATGRWCTISTSGYRWCWTP